MKIKKKPETKVRLYPQGRIVCFMPEGFLKRKNKLALVHRRLLPGLLKEPAKKRLFLWSGIRCRKRKKQKKTLLLS